MAETLRQLHDRKRVEKLKAVQQQINNGSLVIRKMTGKERSANPRRAPKPKKRT